MVDKPDYNVGTIAVTTGTKTVTGVGTFWTSAALNAGDFFGVDGYPLARIASTPGVNGTLLLQDNWRGPTLAAGSSYFIRYQPEGSRLTSETVALRQTLSQDALVAFGSLVLAANKLVYATGPTTFNLLDFPAWSRALVGSADIVAARDVLYSDSPPIVILTTGQSNFAVFKSYAWTPAKNFKIWNNVNNDVNSIGTAFINPNPANMNTVVAFANRVAIENPSRKVYLINCSRTGQPISQWLPGASPGTDVFQCILNNVPPALAAAGSTKIDILLWRQGETGGEVDQYLGDFETVQNRFRVQSWFDVQTPVAVFGVINPTDGGADKYRIINNNLMTVVNAGAMTRRFVDLSMLQGSTYWDPGDIPHMTALGYYTSGELAYGVLDGKSGDSFVRIPFVPVLEGLTTPGVGTYSVQAGRLWIVGPIANFSITLSWTAHTGTGVMVIKGLPVVPNNATQYAFNVFASALTYTPQLMARMSGNSDITLFANGAGLVMDTAAQITITGSYFVR